MNTLIPWRTRSLPRLASWPEMENLQNRFDRMLGRSVPSLFAEQAMAWAPVVDFEEREDEFVLTAELPGMSEKDIGIDVEQSTLTLTGEKKVEREERKGKNGRWHLVERSWGRFERSFELPNTVDLKKIEASFEGGVLTVHLPKREAASARRIPIGGK